MKTDDIILVIALIAMVLISVAGGIVIGATLK